jgi:DNA-binding NtrC family response regulator
MDILAQLNLLGESPSFLRALDLIKRFAACDATVLLQGETGTGKEMTARAVHYLGARRDRPFVPVNCGALPDNLLESELFGHEKGAFTDARQSRQGIVAQAGGGTLFLDEVEAMSPRAQVVLLRFLQDRSYRPVGGTLRVCDDVRIIASSNVDLEQMAERRQFRRDLLFRLRVLSLTLPPLRERPGDVRLLAQRFIRRFSEQHGRPPKRLDPACLEWLERQPWPGNVRELENLLLREFLLSDGEVIGVPDAEPAERGSPHLPGALRDMAQGFRRAKARAVADFERSYLQALLAQTHGNLSLAARISHKDRSALSRLIKKHGIEVAQYRG